MQLTTHKERKEKGDLITIYKLMNNFEETDRKDQILRRKGKAGHMRGHKKKNAEKNLLQQYKKIHKKVDT